jgi:uncharacterized protein (TIGR03084 family)
MEDVMAALAEQQDELAGLLASMAPDGWRRPTRCEGWVVADVILHLAQTNDFAIASAERRLDRWGGGDVDAAAAAAVESERGLPDAALQQRWLASTQALRDALDKCDPHDRLSWVAGTLSAHTLATTRLAETWIHTDDVADALGVALAPTHRLRHIARLAWRTLPYAFATAERALAGPVALELRAPDGSTWRFDPDTEPATRVTGDAHELCLVAARRLDPAATSLVTEGPDGVAVLELIRTYA